MADWPRDKIELLSRLWGEKCTIAAGPDATAEVRAFSTRQIARRMGISTNAVIGKAHRLGLERRPSPIGREGPKTPQSIYERARRLRQHEATLGTLPSLHERLAADSFQAGIPEPLPTSALATHIMDNPNHFSSFVQVAASKVVAAARRPAVPAVPVYAQPKPILVKTAKLPACRWPIGDPKTKGFRFCEADSVPGKPYCLDHCKIAYIHAGDIPRPPKEPTDGATRID